MKRSLPRLRRRPMELGEADAFPDVPAVLQRIYRARGVFHPDEAAGPLSALPAPDTLKGLPEATRLLADAVQTGRRVLIVGDYDADGATSTALGVLALRAMGLNSVDYLLPDRFRYGYGLSPAIVELAAEKQPDLIVTVDNGIASHAGVAAARAHGMRVLVTDHHLPAETLPAADAIVNPNQPGCAFPSRSLAGVGVLFYVLSALRARLREQGWFAAGRQEPNLAEWLDLVAVGTVADVVPLDAVNRILVEQGLRRIRAGQCRPGITALLELGKRQPADAVASDLGFAVGPRLNAAGRLADMTEGVLCLLEEDPVRARVLAADLDSKNRERRDIEAGMQADAESLLDAWQHRADLPWGLSVFEPHWHQGVVGILAGRLKDRLHRPVFAFAPGENGEWKGSGRSVPGFHLRDALDAIATAHPGLIERFGGHAMAAGLSLTEEALQPFAQAFDALARQWLSEADLTAEVWSDGSLQAGELSLELARQLRRAGPWGQKFPEPLFDGRFRVLRRRVLGERHLKLGLSLVEGSPMLDAIWFNALPEHPVPEEGSELHLAYRLGVNDYRGLQSLQLLVVTPVIAPVE